MEQFFVDNGCCLCILIVKMGQDGYDCGVKVIVSVYFDFGFDVDLSLMFFIFEEIVCLVVENDVYVVGVFLLAVGYKMLILELVEVLKKWGCEDICVVVGGVILLQDYVFL